MPCRYDVFPTQQTYDAHGDVDVLTQLLCGICSKLEKANKTSTMSPKLRKWWKEHKRRDAARRKEERAVTSTARSERRKAWKKLNKEFG